MASKTRILLADDHAVVRAGLRALIDAQSDLEVVAEASSGDQALALVRAITPDIVILDISMPGTVATETIADVRKASADTQVVVLTMHNDRMYVEAVVAAGAAAYLVKSTAAPTLIECIRLVAQGNCSSAPCLVCSEQVDLCGQPRPAERHSSNPPQAIDLSAREQQVLLLLAQGHTHREIAQQLGISISTVATYRGRLADKLRTTSRAEMLRAAKRRGLLAGS